MNARILIAEDKSVISIVSNALDGYELIETTMLQEAKRAVAKHHIDLFVIGIHVDDSLALELVRFIRTKAQYKDTPLILVRLLPSQNAEVLRETISAMKSLHKISEYLEVELDAAPAEKLRRAAEKLLQSSVSALSSERSEVL